MADMPTREQLRSIVEREGGAPMTARQPLICKLCDGMEVIRVFMTWDSETRTYVVWDEPREVECPCVGV